MEKIANVKWGKGERRNSCVSSEAELVDLLERLDTSAKKRLSNYSRGGSR